MMRRIRPDRHKAESLKKTEPPLTIGDSELEDALQVFEAALREVLA